MTQALELKAAFIEMKEAYLKVPDDIRPKLKLTSFFGEALVLLELWKRGLDPVEKWAIQV
jgi:hypothetical protein